MELYIPLLTFITLIGSSVALECYVCHNQPDNKDKCTKTSVQCRENEDTCLTRIEWRAPNFWTPRSEKIHYVHKGCSLDSICKKSKRELGLRCMRDWYRDWECLECCQGDRCNFYVTLSASDVLPSRFLLLSSLVALLLSRWR